MPGPMPWSSEVPGPAEGSDGREERRAWTWFQHLRADQHEDTAIEPHVGYDIWHGIWYLAYGA